MNTRKDKSLLALLQKESHVYYVTFAQDLSSARKPGLLLYIRHLINQPVLIPVHPVSAYMHAG